MNISQHDKPLMIAVERIVRPLRASQRRKDRMREELFGHLQLIVEREGTLDAALARFGDADEIRRQLQESVPAVEGALFWDAGFPKPFPWLYRRKPADSDLRYAVRVLGHNCIVITLSLVPVVVLAAIFASSKKLADPWLGVVFAVVLLGLMQLCSLFAVMTGSPMARAFANRDYRRVAAIGGLAVCVNALALMLGLLALVTLTMPSLQLVRVAYEASIWVTAISLILAASYPLLAYLSQREDDRREWLELTIDA